MPSTVWVLALAASTLQAPDTPSPSAAQAWPDDKPITRVAQNFAQDLTRIATIDSLIIMGAGTALTLAVHPADDNIKTWADQSSSSASKFGDVVGDGWMVTALSLTAYAVGRVNKDPKLTHVASDLVRAEILNAAFTVPIKAAVDRQRPRGGGHSFPSGHTSAAFAAAAVLQEHGGWKFGVPMYTLATFVGWARVRDKSHWLSDAAFGATIGTMAGHAVVKGHRARVKQWSIVPVKTPGGAGIFFVKR